MQNVAQKLNLVGTPCPMNFVRIKETLDRMPSGQLLQVRLDKPPVGPDVAESISASGYDVLSIQEQEDATILVLRKRPTLAGISLSRRASRRRGGCGSTRRRRW